MLVLLLQYSYIISLLGNSGTHLPQSIRLFIDQLPLPPSGPSWAGQLEPFGQAISSFIYFSQKVPSEFKFDSVPRQGKHQKE